MKFRIFLLLLFTISCSQNYSRHDLKKSYAAKGFAYIYNNPQNDDDEDDEDDQAPKASDNKIAAIKYKDEDDGNVDI